MLNKILYVLFPVTLIINAITAVVPNTFLSVFDSFSMIFTSLMVFSLGWIVTSFVYSDRLSNYNVARHIGLACIVSVPLVAVIFVPSFLYPYIVGKVFTFRFLAIISLCSTFYLYFTDERFHPRLSPFLVV